MDWLFLIKRGIEANAICFDSEAAVGEFSKKLCRIMKDEARRRCTRLKKLYVHPELTIDAGDWFLTHLFEPGAIPTEIKVVGSQIYGCTVVLGAY